MRDDLLDTFHGHNLKGAILDELVAMQEEEVGKDVSLSEETTSYVRVDRLGDVVGRKARQSRVRRYLLVRHATINLAHSGTEPGLAWHALGIRRAWTLCYHSFTKSGRR